MGLFSKKPKGKVIRCSQCGKLYEIMDESEIDNIVNTGSWNSIGHSLYCRDCFETIQQKAGARGANSKKGTIDLIRQWV